MLHTSRKGPEVQEQNIPGKGMASEVTSLHPGMGMAKEGNCCLPNLEDMECKSRNRTKDDECNARNGRARQERRVRFEQANENDNCNGPTGSNAEDATTIREGSEMSIEEMSEDEARNILLNHPLPKARQRTNIVSDDYIPEGRLFGAYATRGEGMILSLKLLLCFLSP